MTLAISSNSPSITTDYTFKRNKTATIEQNDRLNSFLEILEKEEDIIQRIDMKNALEDLQRYIKVYKKIK